MGDISTLSFYQGGYGPVALGVSEQSSASR